MKTWIKQRFIDAENKRLTPPIIFSRQERFLVAHMIRWDLKDCRNDLAIKVLTSALEKLDAEAALRDAGSGEKGT